MDRRNTRTLRRALRPFWNLSLLDAEFSAPLKPPAKVEDWRPGLSQPYHVFIHCEFCFGALHENMVSF